MGLLCDLDDVLITELGLVLAFDLGFGLGLSCWLLVWVAWSFDLRFALSVCSLSLV